MQGSRTRNADSRTADNEHVQDLLEPANSDLDVREAPGKGTFVAGAASLRRLSPLCCCQPFSTLALIGLLLGASLDAR